MANIFLAGYFMSITFDKLFDKEWNLAMIYCGLNLINVVLAISLKGE